jgi:hypothetical protein
VALSRSLWLLAAALLLITVALEPAAPADTGGSSDLRLTVDVRLKPARASTPRRPRGISIQYVQKLTTVSGQRPEQDVKRIAITLPRGFRVNVGAFRRCRVSAYVVRDSPAACPSKSEIGSGWGTADARPTIPQLIPARVRAFAGISDLDSKGYPQRGRPALLVVAESQIGAVTARSLFTLKIRGRRLVLDFPPGAGGGAGSPYLISEMALKLRNVRGKRRLPLVQTPTRCGGRWRFTQTTKLFGGQSVTARADVPCER